nr:hypothetical protein [Mammaliicoccus sp. Marseille-Q6498]
MAQSMNQISLYKKMDEELSKKVDLKIQPPKLYYIDDSVNKEIVVNEDFDDILTINSYDSMWSPNENNLNVKQLFIFNSPSALYGDKGVTMEGNEIGLGAHIHSRNSNFQKTLHISTIPNIQDTKYIEFSHVFNMGTLRGNIVIDFFLYLHKIESYNNIQADKVGMVLSEGNIHSLEVIVDGEGSVFPISEFEDKNGPLWKLDKNWIEPNIDMFDISNVNLSLNTSHALFEQVKSGKTRASKAIMSEIMLNAMSMIIQEVLIVENYSLDGEDEILQGSILQAVQYWVNAFEIDTTSLFSISNSIRNYWDKKMLEGEKSDD